MELGNTQIGRDTLYKRKQNVIPKQVAQGQTQQKGGYGEELKQQLQTLGDVKRESPVIQAKRVDPIVSETEQYTKDAVKTAMKELEKFIASRGLGGEDEPGDFAQTAPFAGGGGGGGSKSFFTPLSRMSTQQLVDRDNEMYGDTFPAGSFGIFSQPTDGMTTQQMVDRDNEMYGNTFPAGAIGIGSKPTDDFSKNPEYQSTVGDFAKEQEKLRLAQVMSSLPSDYKKTEQQAIDDFNAFRKLAESGLTKTIGGEDAQVNVGSGSMGTFGFGTLGKGAPSGDDLKEGSFSISDKGREQALQNRIEAGIKSTGIPSGTSLPAGSFGISTIQRTPPQVSQATFAKPAEKATTTTFGGAVDVAKALKTIKAKQEAPKQSVASLPSNYKATEKAAFDKAKSYKDSKAKGDAAAKATNTPSKPPAGSFGISEAGKKQAEANRKEAKKKAEAQKKKSSPSPKKSSPSSSTSKSGRKSNTGSKKSSRGTSGSRSKGGTSKGGSKGTSGSKKASRGAKGSSSSRSKGGTSKGGARTNRRRSRRRCDIRCKFDISILTNQNLIRDDLADVAYFVKDLQEIN